MLRNYLLITIRNLIKNPIYSLINIVGLSIGIICCTLILLWVHDETSFDKFLNNYNRLHQVWVNADYDGKINSWNSVPLPTYEAMKTTDPDIVNSTVCDWGGNHLLTYGEKKILKEGLFVSEEFLEMFDYPLISGEASSVLDDPKSIVITESLAKAIFGDESPLDKVIRVDNESDLRVTGILKDIPKNSSFEFEYLLTWKLREQVNEWVAENRDSWGNYSFQVFIELSEKDKKDKVEANIKGLLTENGQDDIDREFFLHPMEKWRLYSSFENGQLKGGRGDYVQLFSIIALFVVIIACINFMNLSTARSERRAREVGIRKSVGSTRANLIQQFIGESLFISLMAYLIAILSVQLLLPSYNQLVEKELFLDYFSLEFLIFSLIAIVFTGLVSGSYPAFYLSSFEPVKVLKGKVKVGKGMTTPRKVLVTLQFGFSIFLIIGMIVILKQIDMVKNRELGYDQQNLISIQYTDEIEQNYETLKTELEETQYVESVTRSNAPITSIWSNNFLGWPGKPEDLRVIFTTVATEYDYTKTMGINLIMGRDFSRDIKTDTSAIIINKAALDLMKLEDPIGTELDLWDNKRTLIGVMDDVLMGSPYREVKPMFMIIDPNWVSVVTVRLSKHKELPQSITAVEEIFKKHNPAYPFEYDFADVQFQKKFSTIEMTSNLASIFAILALVITGLGLFGLASFTAEQRTKEIGIRKVLGASVSSLVGMISKDFSILVVTAFAIFAPLAGWGLNVYLDRYPLRIPIEWWIYPLTGMIALVFALLIVSTQALKAAYADPVKSLKNE